MSYFFNIFLVLVLMSAPVDNFKAEQKKQPRVKAAYEEKESIVKSYVTKAGLDYGSVQVLLRALKYERKLQVFARDDTHSKFKLIHTYDFCSSSGELGPKRKQGDRQIPEGIYHIDRFNAWSNFHLSLGINYPNAADKKKSSHEKLGGDIFIHGNCVTIGCIPITDDKIKELYILCVEAKSHGQNKIPVYMFPFDMSDESDILWHGIEDIEKQKFWNNLSLIYNEFESTRQVVNFSIDAQGDYEIK